ncbi:MAG: DNA polymerase IV, partial [Bdellovibrionota bacterium]
IVRPNFTRYKEESRAIREIFERFTSIIQPLSLDEAYLDVTGSEHFGGSATRIAEEIRRLIREERNLTASAGVAPNKFLAKVASDMNKPDGCTVIKPADIADFVFKLPIQKIWGVGKVTAKRMNDKGIFTCGDLQKYNVGQLTAMFGSWGPTLFDYARGIDNRVVHEDRERKSLSVEETYYRDLTTLDECLEKLPELYEDWLERMERAQKHDDVLSRVRGISVKLKFHDFTGTTHDRAFTNGSMPKFEDFRSLLIETWERRTEAVRLIGIGARLEGSERSDKNRAQLKLF